MSLGLDGAGEALHILVDEASKIERENAVNRLRVNCVQGITANVEHLRNMVLNSLGIITVLKTMLGYRQCAEIAREGYEAASLA